MRAFETEKTDVAEVDRSIYDIKDAANAAFEVSSGLTPEIVEKISEEKHDPEWMRIFRLKALETYNKMPVQNWGPSIAGLDVDAVKTVANGIKAYHNDTNALIIITHNAKILEGLQVDYVHVLDDARIVRTGNGELVSEIIEEGFAALKEDEAK